MLTDRLLNDRCLFLRRAEPRLAVIKCIFYYYYFLKLRRDQNKTWAARWSRSERNGTKILCSMKRWSSVTWADRSTYSNVQHSCKRKRGTSPLCGAVTGNNTNRVLTDHSITDRLHSVIHLRRRVKHCSMAKLFHAWNWLYTSFRCRTRRFHSSKA